MLQVRWVSLLLISLGGRGLTIVARRVIASHHLSVRNLHADAVHRLVGIHRQIVLCATQTRGKRTNTKYIKRQARTDGQTIARRGGRQTSNRGA